MNNPPTRVDRWNRIARAPLAVLGVIFILAFSVLIIAPDAPGGITLAAIVSVIITWLTFLVDYLVCIVLTPRGRRWRYTLRHPLQLLSVLLPVFRAVRVIDLLRQLPYFHKRTGSAIRGEVIVFASAYAITFVFFIALTTLYVERSAPGATITSFGNAIWWAFVTLSTVGYGDIAPVTVLGRFYAVLLMIGGIVIIGVASGTAVSYISERIRNLEPERRRTPSAPEE